MLDRAFRRSFAPLRETTERWTRSLAELAKRSRSLADWLGELPIRSVRTANGRQIAHVGRISGVDFVKLIRRGESVRAYELAMGKRLSDSARSAFREMDKVTSLDFPDAKLLKRERLNIEMRKNLTRSGVLRGANATITDAVTLEKLVTRNSSLVEGARRVTTKASRTKRLLYLGGYVTVAGIGIAGLCHLAARLARAGTGCFVYLIDEHGSVKKYKIRGCSCPLSLNDTKGDTSALWSESDLPANMRIAGSACSTDKSVDYYCVHCDWNETDVTSVNYVDREHFPDNAQLRCERIDALDAFIDFLSENVDDAFDVARDVGKGVKSSLSTVLAAIPMIFASIVAIGLIVALVLAYRFVRAVSAGIGRDHSEATSFR